MRTGHIKISRKMFDGSDLFWSEKRKFSRAEAWIDLIQMAAWRDGTPYTSAAHDADILARGELVASLRYLAVRWQWSKNTVSRYLDIAEKAGRLEGQRMGHHGRVYLLVNYATYQGNGPADGTGDDAEDGTVAGQSWDDRGTVVGQRRSSKAVKQESVEQPASRAAGAAGPELPADAKSVPKRAAEKPKGEPAPWMGEVRRVWQEKYPGSEPRRGTAEALRPAMRAHTPEVVVPRLAKYLQNTKARFVNLNTFASTVMDPEWAPSGAALVGNVTGDMDPAVLAGRMYDVLERVDAIEIDARSTHMRLNNAVMAGAVPKEDAAAVWRVVKAGDLVISRRRETAVRFLEATLRTLASEAAAPDLPARAVA